MLLLVKNILRIICDTSSILHIFQSTTAIHVSFSASFACPKCLRYLPDSKAGRKYCTISDILFSYSESINFYSLYSFWDVFVLNKFGCSDEPIIFHGILYTILDMISSFLFSYCVLKYHDQIISINHNNI